MMSEEKDKRTAYSIYLTPRAANILEKYTEGSGYASKSRTVEEIILAFHEIYKATHTMQLENLAKNVNNPIVTVLLTAFQNVTARLNWPAKEPLS